MVTRERRTRRERGKGRGEGEGELTLCPPSESGRSGNRARIRGTPMQAQGVCNLLATSPARRSSGASARSSVTGPFPGERPGPGPGPELSSG